GLRKRIVPDGIVPTAAEIALFDEIAVREQHRAGLTLRTNRRAVDGHHIRPVEEISDAAKTLGLALRAEHVARDIETRQLRVRGRVDLGLDLERKGCGRARDREALPVELVVASA